MDNVCPDIHVELTIITPQERKKIMNIEIKTNTARGVWELAVIRESGVASDLNYYQELDHYPTEAEILQAMVKKRGL